MVMFGPVVGSCGKELRVWTVPPEDFISGVPAMWMSDITSSEIGSIRQSYGKIKSNAVKTAYA